jgi:DNA polymerase
MTSGEIDPAEGRQLLEALAWQIELGADEAIAEEPMSRFEAEQAKPVELKAAAPAAEPVNPASTIAAACADLDALRQAMAAFEGCALKKGARNTVFSDGNPAADLMIIGEAPGRDEDQQGLPFVGRSGQLLDRMMQAIGRDRKAETPDQAVYITNVLPWRPPQNRDPSSDEMSMMKAFLLRHIDLAKPKVLLTMGNAASKTLLDAATGITRLRGKWHEHSGVPVMPSFHPAALLRNPAQKKMAWMDLLAIRARLEDRA